MRNFERLERTEKHQIIFFKIFLSKNFFLNNEKKIILSWILNNIKNDKLGGLLTLNAQ